MNILKGLPVPNMYTDFFSHHNLQDCLLSIKDDDCPFLSRYDQEYLTLVSLTFDRWLVSFLFLVTATEDVIYSLYRRIMEAHKKNDGEYIG